MTVSENGYRRAQPIDSNALALGLEDFLLGNRDVLLAGANVNRYLFATDAPCHTRAIQCSESSSDHGHALANLFGFAAMEPYRLRRIVSFMDPWADPFASGFQLTQALIAVGRGELLGVGIGASIQKLFYLPEAHTDFIFAVLAEEFGLAGVIVVLALFLLLVTRIMVIGIMAHRNDKPFAGFVAYGIGLWIGLQAVVSVGVNLGVLPTKGLTLPLISSGGSSMLMTLLALGIVLRIKYEMDRDKVVYCRKKKNLNRVPA